MKPAPFRSSPPKRRREPSVSLCFPAYNEEATIGEVLWEAHSLLSVSGLEYEIIVCDDGSIDHTGAVISELANHLPRLKVLHHPRNLGIHATFGHLYSAANNEYVFLGREMIRSKDYSEKTAQEIDDEVKRIVDEAYRKAKHIIDTNRDKLELIANCLLEYETLEGTQVEEIVRTGKFTPPPPPPDVTPPTGAQAATPLGDVLPKPSKPEIGGLGTPAPATA